MKVANRVSFEVRPYRDEDEARVLELLRVSLGGGPAGDRSPAFFRWKHFENPFGRSHMLVAEQQGRLVGLRAFMRWELTTGDRTVRAVRAVDTATHPEFRGQGVFRRLTLQALDDLRGDAELVFNTPNEKSLPGYLKMGWRTVGRAPVWIRARRPLRVLRGFRTARGPTGMRAGPPVAAVTADEALRDAEGLQSFWGPYPGAGLATRRSLEYLRWRYGRAPLLGYRAVRHGDAIGIFRVRPRGGLWETTVAELLVPSGDRATPRRLLSAIRRAAGVDHVACSFPAGSQQARALRAAGFVRVPGGMTLVVNPLAGDLPIDPTDLSSWALALGDLEVF